jgi:hypothetical protein
VLGEGLNYPRWTIPICHLLGRQIHSNNKIKDCTVRCGREKIFTGNNNPRKKWNCVGMRDSYTRTSIHTVYSFYIMHR